MSGDKPVYNPEGLSEEELKADEEAAAKKRAELMAKLAAKTSEKKDVEPKPKLGTPKQTIRSGLGVHHEGRSLASGKSDKRDKSEIQEDKEAAMERLKNKIRELLKSYKLHKIFNFNITVSDKDREKYVFKLLKNYSTAEEFEDRLGNIFSRLEDLLKNKYGDKL